MRAQIRAIRGGFAPGAARTFVPRPFCQALAREPDTDYLVRETHRRSTLSHRTLPETRGISRRAFIVTAAVGGAVLAAATWLSQRERTGSPAARPTGNAPAALTDDELRDIAALALLLFPPGDDVSAPLIEQTARFWAQGRVRRMPAPPPYRLAIAEADAVARGRLHALSPAAAERVVSELMSRPPGSAFRRAAADLLHGLYTLVPGWRLVGYTSAPGYAAGPDAYTRPPATA